MRSILSPCFTSSKMRAMSPLMTGCAERFTNYFLNLNEEVVSVEVKEAFTRYATDVIGSTAFGVEVDSLKQPENTFYVMGKRATTFDFWKMVRFFISVLAPKLNALLGLMIMDKETLDFFVDLVDQTIKTREEKGIIRPDMIHLLMEARKGRLKNEESRENDSSDRIVSDIALKNITNIDIAAQAMIFFLGGFETSSNLMSFMAYELAANKYVQDRLRKEIQDTLDECNGQLTHEALLKMKYMDMVVSETLRKWPSNLVIDRECTKPYTLEPVQSREKPIHLEKGSYVSAMVYCIHRDPKYFPNPDIFDPERFSSENIDKIQPYTYLPFGVGPRSCIGSRFALLETKALFFYLLMSFEIVRTEKSCKSVQLERKGISYMIKGGNWLGLRALKRGV
ncbi:unnamed protein product [Acanthoscelides obtectus]|nr:unnamed protein product [Acanthoscelides obtectus]CAK1632322.1 Cytochrome P450 9e2 [Acanthoscelides obtectus]